MVKDSCDYSNYLYGRLPPIRAERYPAVYKNFLFPLSFPR